MKRFCSARELLLSALMLLATLVFLFTADKARSSGEPTTVPSAPAATDAPATSAAPASAPVSSQDSLFDTPADVLEKESEALAADASAEPVGTVQEVFYRDQGATNAVGAVRVKNATHEQNPDFAALIEEGPALEVENKNAPTVLIFHTHTSEAYLGAAREGCRLLFVASLEKADKGYLSCICVKQIPENHPAYHLKGTENAIMIRSSFHPLPIVIEGPGEGALQAASSILDDILR